MAFSVAIAEGPPFKRYQTIIDRKPFGPEPVGFDPESAPGSAASGGEIAEGEMTPEQRSAEEQQLAASVRVSILNVTPAGDVKVGFTDSSAKPPENYYLKVGASQNGWTVKAADPAAESVTLEKGGVEVTVKLGETTGGNKGGAKGGMPGRGLMRGGRFGRADDGAAPRGEGALHQRMGGIARLRQQRMEEEARAREAAEKKREADAAAKAEREEREAREAEEKQRAAEERAQQREALLQIQEQLKKQREENAAKREKQEQQGEEDNDT